MGTKPIRPTLKSIVVFVHSDNRVKGARVFTDNGNNINMTRFESGMSFLQVKDFFTMMEKLPQVRGTICVNRREIAYTRLDAVAREDNSTQTHCDIWSRASGHKIWWGVLHYKMCPAG